MRTKADRQGVSDALVKTEGGRVAEARQDASPWSAPTGFFSFRYSSTEIFSEGSHLHVRLRETRYENGRLKSEECEGTLDRQAYHQMMREAQGHFLNQMVNFTRLLLAPFSGGRRHDE